MQLQKITPISELPLPFASSSVAAGFPSPADDYIEKTLDLNEHLIKHPSATFYARASGNSMIGRGIHDGDLLIIDRAVEPFHGAVVIAAIDGLLTCKILDKQRQCLDSANPAVPAVALNEFSDCIIEGVVTHSIRDHVCPR